MQFSDLDAKKPENDVHAMSLTLGLYKHETVLAKRALHQRCNQ